MMQLIAQYRATGRVVDRRGPPAQPFARRYTTKGVRRLAAVDVLHGTLSGPATHTLCERDGRLFGDSAFERLAKIPNGYLYNLRASKTYQRVRGPFDKTRPVQRPISERRKPRPAGRPGFIRVDSVHQGDLDGIKGLYHLDRVDEVTQFQFVGSVERISGRS